MTEEEYDERCWLEAMELREQMLAAAIGHMTLANVPSRYLYGILENYLDRNLTFACQIVLHNRGEEWQNSESTLGRIRRAG